MKALTNFRLSTMWMKIVGINMKVLLGIINMEVLNITLLHHSSSQQEPPLPTSKHVSRQENNACYEYHEPTKKKINARRIVIIKI